MLAGQMVWIRTLKCKGQVNSAYIYLGKLVTMLCLQVVLYIYQLCTRLCLPSFVKINSYSPILLTIRQMEIK